MTEQQAKEQAILALAEALASFSLEQLGEISSLILAYSQRKVAEREGRMRKVTLEVVK